MKAIAPTTRFCSICSKQVSLENCKVDEGGLPVHESCYVSKVAHTAPHRRNHTSMWLLNTTPAWEQAYKVAILETDDGKLPLRLTEAMAAIDARLSAMLLSDGLSPNELQAIIRALVRLDILRRERCSADAAGPNIGGRGELRGTR
jgi:hypothetical protein